MACSSEKKNHLPTNPIILKRMLPETQHFFLGLSMKIIKTINEGFVQILFSIKIGFNFVRTQILQGQMPGQMTFTLCVNKLSCSVLPNSVDYSDYMNNISGLQLRAECLLIRNLTETVCRPSALLTNCLCLNSRWMRIENCNFRLLDFVLLYNDECLWWILIPSILAPSEIPVNLLNYR
jgi:hypothetical protein